MIVCYAGTPGSCKTLEAVRRVVNNLRGRYENGELIRRKVYTNITGMNKALHREAISAILGIDPHELDECLIWLSDEQIVHYWDFVTEGALVVIDEVHFLINNRDWDTPKNKEFNLQASVHRKLGLDILLVTQDIGKVDKHTRGLIEWTYFYRKNNFFGSLIKKQFIRYSYIGDDHQGKPLAHKKMVMNSLYFNCYESYTHASAKEIDFQEHVNILKHPVFYIIPVMLCLSIYLFSKSSFAHGDLFNSKQAQKRMEEKNAKQKSQVAVSSPGGASFPNRTGVSSRTVASFKGNSSARLGSSNVQAITSSPYQSYSIEGVIKDGSKIWVIVNSKYLKLPSKYLQAVDLEAKNAEGLVSYFGPVVHPQPSRPESQKPVMGLVAHSGIIESDPQYPVLSQGGEIIKRPSGVTNWPHGD